LAVRRRWPVALLAVVFAGSTVAFLSGTIPGYAAAAPYIAAALALYQVALAERRRRSVPALAACLLGTAAVGVFYTADRSEALGGIAFGWVLMGGVWLLGRTVRGRRADAARAMEQRARQAVTDERLRIARELHDVVAHSMSLIAVKAAIANHVADDRPAEVRDALRIIEETSRSALTEMRRTLGVLRSEPGPADLDPAPGLTDLPLLVERAAEAGVRVDLDVRGTDGLPEGISLAAYRIVQEAVTNVVKHAAPAGCRTTVAVEHDAVRIEVVDDGAGAVDGLRWPGDPNGHGLIGMRERATLFGGTLTAGPEPAGGFAVRARLPLAAVDRGVVGDGVAP
jgi:signal transduction histidine kinase